MDDIKDLKVTDAHHIYHMLQIGEDPKQFTCYRIPKHDKADCESHKICQKAQVLLEDLLGYFQVPDEEEKVKFWQKSIIKKCG